MVLLALQAAVWTPRMAPVFLTAGGLRLGWITGLLDKPLELGVGDRRAGGAIGVGCLHGAPGLLIVECQFVVLAAAHHKGPGGDLDPRLLFFSNGNPARLRACLDALEAHNEIGRPTPGDHRPDKRIGEALAEAVFPT